MLRIYGPDSRGWSHYIGFSDAETSRSNGVMETKDGPLVRWFGSLKTAQKSCEATSTAEVRLERLVSGHDLEICSHDYLTLRGHFGHFELWVHRKLNNLPYGDTPSRVRVLPGS